jgi:WD40 repeat protein
VTRLQLRATGAVGPGRLLLRADEEAVSKFALAYTFRGHHGCVNTARFSTESQFLITGSDDCRIIFWDIFSRKRLHVMNDTGHEANIFSALTLPRSGDRTLVSTGADGRVVLHTLDSRTHTVLGEHVGRTHRLSLDFEAPSVFLSCGEDGIVATWDVRAMTRVRHAVTGSDGEQLALYAMSLNPATPTELALGGTDPSVRLFDRRAMSRGAFASYCPAHLRDAAVHVTGVAHSTDGR